MKGISTIIVAILLLMISISLAGFGYVFFTTMFTSITTESEEVMGTTVERMLAQVKIESIASTSVSVRNIGKVNLTDFAVYVDETRDTNPSLPSAPLEPGDVATITINPPPNVASGSVVKVTTAQGAVAVQTAP
jgi:FlaG/FlaF family flagellin (archaellin)